MGTHVTTCFSVSLLAVVSLGHLGFSLSLCVQRRFACGHLPQCKSCSAGTVPVPTAESDAAATVRPAQGCAATQVGPTPNADTSRAEEARWVWVCVRRAGARAGGRPTFLRPRAREQESSFDHSLCATCVPGPPHKLISL